jgi:alcohol dehydrogenase (NADP+)
MTATTTLAYAAQAADVALTPFNLERRAPGPDDVQIDILYCGVCHSDLHTARNEWKNTIYPSVPGHEIVGRISAVGARVSKFKLGDLAGVGCMVDSCQRCTSCGEGLEQYCEAGFTGTYNGPVFGGDNTFGGYSGRIVVQQKFVLKISHPIKVASDLAAVAPLLCAGITTYSPLRQWDVKKGDKVGIVGFGGLGHVAVKIAAAMGAHVVLFTTSPGKAADAKRFGAAEVVISTDTDALAAQQNSFDFILNTVAAQHDLDPFIAMLKRDRTMVLVGAPEHAHPAPNVFGLIFKRRRLGGSLIGGIQETQEMLDFCAQHGIVCDIELIAMQHINTAYERMLKNDVKYRFVIDMATLQADPSAA